MQNPYEFPSPKLQNLKSTIKTPKSKIQAGPCVAVKKPQGTFRFWILDPVKGNSHQVPTTQQFNNMFRASCVPKMPRWASETETPFPVLFFCRVDVAETHFLEIWRQRTVYKLMSGMDAPEVECWLARLESIVSHVWPWTRAPPNLLYNGGHNSSSWCW